MPVSPQTIRRIATPINFSSVSDDGLRWAVHLAQKYQAELILLHVLPSPTPIFEDRIRHAIRSRACLIRTSRKASRSRYKGAGLPANGNRFCIRSNVRAARLERVDLIIVATRYRRGLSRLFAGSLASRVMTRAHCPVLAVPSRYGRKSALKINWHSCQQRHVS